MMRPYTGGAHGDGRGHDPDDTPEAPAVTAGGHDPDDTPEAPAVTAGGHDPDDTPEAPAVTAGVTTRTIRRGRRR